MSWMEVCRIWVIFETSLTWCLEVLRFLGCPFVKPWSCSLIIVDKILGCWEKLEEVMTVLHTNIYLFNNQLLSCQKPKQNSCSTYSRSYHKVTQQSKTNSCKKFCCTPWQVHPPRQPNICIWHNHDSSASSQKTNRISEAKLKQQERGKKKSILPSRMADRGSSHEMIQTDAETNAERKKGCKNLTVGGLGKEDASWKTRAGGLKSH